MIAQNAKKSFKCNKCGNMFEITKNNRCPLCNNECTDHTCEVIYSSDEEY